LTVAQTAIIGSVLVNALLVLGVVLIAGTVQSKDGVMRFSPRLPNDTATLLLASSFTIVLIAVVTTSHDHAARHVKAISVVGAIALLVVYGIWMYGYIRSDPTQNPGGTETPRISLKTALTMLIVAG